MTALATPPTTPKKPDGRKRIFRRLADVRVDEISLVDHPAVPEARILLVKRDLGPTLSEPVRKVMDSFDSLSKDEVKEAIHLLKAQYSPTDDEMAGNGGVEPESTPEQHVQALVDMMDTLPEDALDHIIALADAAGIEVDDLPSVQGGDADSMDSVPMPQEATGSKPDLQSAMGAIHEHMKQTDTLPPNVKDALSTIHQHIAGVSTDPAEGAGGAEDIAGDPADGPSDMPGKGKPTDIANENNEDEPELTQQDKGPTDKDGKGVPKPIQKPVTKPSNDQLPGVAKKPTTPPKVSVPGTPANRQQPPAKKPRDPRVERMLARRKPKPGMPVANRDVPEPVAPKQETKPLDFMEELSAGLQKRNQPDDETLLVGALNKALEIEEKTAERVGQLTDRFNRASGGRC